MFEGEPKRLFCKIQKPFYLEHFQTKMALVYHLSRICTCGIWLLFPMLLAYYLICLKREILKAWKWTKPASWWRRKNWDTNKEHLFSPFLETLTELFHSTSYFPILDKPDKAKKQRIFFSSSFSFFFFLINNNPASSNSTYNLTQDSGVNSVPGNWSAADQKKACGKGPPRRNARNRTSDLSGWENGASWDAPLMVAKERMFPYTCVQPPTWKPQNDN